MGEMLLASVNEQSCLFCHRENAYHHEFLKLGADEIIRMRAKELQDKTDKIVFLALEAK